MIIRLLGKSIKINEKVFNKSYGFFVVTFFVLTVTLSGCTNSIPELTEEEEQMITQYAAKLLLEYDENYNKGVLDDESISEETQRLEKIADIKSQVVVQKELKEKEKKEKKEEKEKHSGNDTENEEKVSADIDSFLEIEGLDIEYSGMTICSQYPENTENNDWQGITHANAGNKLAVLNFEVANNTGGDYYLDMAEHKGRFVININDSINKSPLTTMLINDFIYYKGTIPAGEKINNVIIVQISEEEAGNISSVKLKMKYNGSIAESFLQ